MGRGCTRESERVLASVGKLNFAPSKFTHCKDVPNGGVLLALPALLLNGLLNHLKLYLIPSGYYHLRHILLTLSFMALLRIKNPESIRKVSPGEFGKLLGLDRCPEVKTLRAKLELMSNQEQGAEWGQKLSVDWMSYNPETAGVLYVDGHVRPYYGKQTKLPARYVSRQRLCLRGTTDYWVNDLLGLPFFVVTKTINSGLIKTLNEDILPRLIKDVPNQPSEAILKKNPYMHRFLLVFDREGYSSTLFADYWAKRIACITYKKNVKDKWPISEFYPMLVNLSNGNTEEMLLAERGTFIGGKIWMREVRKLTKSGHQTSIISTAYELPIEVLAVLMFSRWCQENYFKYMLKHFDLDRLIEYQLEFVHGTKIVINPEYREIEKQIKSLRGKRDRRHAKCSKLNLTSELTEKKQKKMEQKRAYIIEEISLIENELEVCIKTRTDLKRYITFDELPDSEKFKKLKEEKKKIVDIIKMISYRAETTLSSIAKPHMSKPDEVRSFIGQILKTEVDLLPNYDEQVLEIRLHNLNNNSSDRVAEKICEELNESEMKYPGTNLRIFYKVGTN